MLQNELSKVSNDLYIILKTNLIVYIEVARILNQVILIQLV